jgi:hypothetical protein
LRAAPPARAAFPLLRAQEQEAEKAAGGGGGGDKQEKLWALMSSYLASDVHSIQRSVANHVEYTLAGSRFNFDQFRAYVATAHSIRDRLIESWCVSRRPPGATARRPRRPQTRIVRA